MAIDAQPGTDEVFAAVLDALHREVGTGVLRCSDAEFEEVLRSAARAVVAALDATGLGPSRNARLEEDLEFAEAWAAERGRRVEELEENLRRSDGAVRLLRAKLDALGAAFASATGMDPDGLDVMRAVARNLDLDRAAS